MSTKFLKNQLERLKNWILQFLELYISRRANPRKLVFYRLKGWNSSRSDFGWFWWKKSKQGCGKIFFPTFKFVIISFCNWKPNPLGLGNCSVPSFCKTCFRCFCSLFTGTLDKIAPHATGLFILKKSKSLTREGWFRVFIKLRVENHNKNYNIQYFLCYR